MAQSIESIWKEGFLQDKALVAPKVNDLYNQKSIHTIAKYKRMFRINIKAIVIGAILLVPLSWLVKMPYLGIMMSIMLAPLAYVNWQKLKELEQIKEQSTSYEYLLQMKQWIESKTASNIKMSRIIYPYIVLTMAVSFWMMDINGLRLGQLATDAFLEFFPNSILLAGIPLIGIVLLVLAMVLMYFLAERFYKADLQAIYGSVLGKLDELIDDMEVLREG